MSTQKSDNNIYLLDTQADLSISEKVAQQKIYKIYMETQNLSDKCGCGTLASIFYMGHNTSCDDFKHVHERESHEVLLAILNKEEKLSFDAEFDPRHQNYEVQADADAVIADADHMVPIPDAREIFSVCTDFQYSVLITTFTFAFAFTFITLFFLFVT